MWITDWTVRAACKGTDPDELFVQGAAQNTRDSPGDTLEPEAIPISP